MNQSDTYKGFMCNISFFIQEFLQTLIKSKKTVSDIDEIKENGFKEIKEQSRRYSAKKIPTPTTLMTKRYWQTHPPKRKHSKIVWNESLQALASMSMHTKRNTCNLIKQGISPH